MIETDDDQIIYPDNIPRGSVSYAYSVNGALYWVGSKTKYGRRTMADDHEYSIDLYETLIIMWFDLCDEKSGRTKLPKGITCK